MGIRFGNDVTVVEMDGEIDMDNMESQLKARGCSHRVIELRGGVEELRLRAFTRRL